MGQSLSGVEMGSFAQVLVANGASKLFERSLSWFKIPDIVANSSNLQAWNWLLMLKT